MLRAFILAAPEIGLVLSIAHVHHGLRGADADADAAFVAAEVRNVRTTTRSGTYAATGELALAGRMQRYEGTFAFRGDRDRIALDGELRVDLRSFGLRLPSLVMLTVDPMVTVRLHLVAVRVP